MAAEPVAPKGNETLIYFANPGNNWRKIKAVLAHRC